VYQLLITRKYLTARIMPLLAALAVALCTAMVLIVWSVMGGFLSTFMTSGRSLSGDLMIEWPYTGFGHYQDLIARLEKDPLVAAAAPMIETGAFITLPDGRGKTVILRGIEGTSYARVSDYESVLWWRTLDKPGPRDTKGTDPRLLPENMSLLERTFENGKTLTRQDEITGAAKPALVPGIHVSGFSDRDGEAGVYHPIKRRKPRADGTFEVLNEFLPRDGFITVNVLPVDSKGNAMQAATRRLPVANEFQTGTYEADNRVVFMELGELQHMLQMHEALSVKARGSGVWEIQVDPATGQESLVEMGTVIGKDPARVTSVIVKGKEDVSDEAALFRLRDAVRRVYAEFASVHEGKVPSAEIISVQTWIDMNFTIISAVKKEISLVLILFIIISFVAVFLVLSIFWSMISEKTRDIGILRAMGASRSGVAGLWVFYGFLLGLVGAVLGVSLAYTIVLNINPIHEWLGRALGVQVWDPKIYYFTTIPAKVDPVHAAMVLAGGMVSAVVGALIPAIHAARMNPVKSLRFE
jgi:lipoprotein-releasing system permease protein